MSRPLLVAALLLASLHARAASTDEETPPPQPSPSPSPSPVPAVAPAAAPDGRLLVGLEFSYGTGFRGGYEKWTDHLGWGGVVHYSQISRREGALNDGDVVSGTAVSVLAVAGVYADRKHRWGLEAGAGPGYVTGTYTDRETDEGQSHDQGAVFVELSVRLWPIVLGVSLGMPTYEFPGAPDGLALVGGSGRFWIGVRFRIGAAGR